MRYFLYYCLMALCQVLGEGSSILLFVPSTTVLFIIQSLCRSLAIWSFSIIIFIFSTVGLVFRFSIDASIYFQYFLWMYSYIHRMADKMKREVEGFKMRKPKYCMWGHSCCLGETAFALWTYRLLVCSSGFKDAYLQNYVMSHFFEKAIVLK